MPTSHRPDPPEFRAEAIRLLRSGGKSLAPLARDLDVSSEPRRLWRKHADRDELHRLRRQNQVLREEREILVQAAAFVAKETDARR